MNFNINQFISRAGQTVRADYILYQIERLLRQVANYDFLTREKNHQYRFIGTICAKSCSASTNYTSIAAKLIKAFAELFPKATVVSTNLNYYFSHIQTTLKGNRNGKP